MDVLSRRMINSPLFGEIQYSIRKKLSKRYSFNDWHTIPLYQKKYISEIYKLLEDGVFTGHDTFAEVGCGLGDIIGNVRTRGKKYGYDLSGEVIKAAGLLHKDTIFTVGSFDEVKAGKIDCLIMVNFIHEISPSDMKRYMNHILQVNTVNYFLFDVVEQIKYSEYLYTHDGNDMLGNLYECIYTGNDYVAAHGAKRHIELWKRKI